MDEKNLPDLAKMYLEQLNHEEMAMGKIKAMAKTVKKDHDLGLALWSTGRYYPRLFASLIFDKKKLDLALIEALMVDLDVHDEKDALRISEWLLANQLVKAKATIKLLEGFQHHELPMLRRLFWYYQARLRWTGKTDYTNTCQLVEDIEANLEGEEAIVQWTMNFLAAWIGIFDKKYRDQMVALGQRLGLYIEEVAPKGCTPNYLPDFIGVEVKKRGL